MYYSKPIKTQCMSIVLYDNSKSRVCHLFCMLLKYNVTLQHSSNLTAICYICYSITKQVCTVALCATSTQFQNQVCVICFVCYSNTIPNPVCVICSVCYPQHSFKPSVSYLFFMLLQHHSRQSLCHSFCMLLQHSSNPSLVHLFCVLLQHSYNISVCHLFRMLLQCNDKRSLRRLFCNLLQHSSNPSMRCLFYMLLQQKSFLICKFLQHNSKPRVQRTPKSIFIVAGFVLFTSNQYISKSFQSTQCQINICISSNHLCHFNHTLLNHYVTQQIPTKFRILARSILLLASFSEIKQTKTKIFIYFTIPVSARVNVGSPKIVSTIRLHMNEKTNSCIATFHALNSIKPIGRTLLSFFVKLVYRLYMYTCSYILCIGEETTQDQNILIIVVIILWVNTIEQNITFETDECMYQGQWQCSCHQSWYKVTILLP